MTFTECHLKSFYITLSLLRTSNQSCPDMSFNLSKLSSSVNHATVEHILIANTGHQI